MRDFSLDAPAPPERHRKDGLLRQLVFQNLSASQKGNQWTVAFCAN
jgi:hypothetical protein